MRLLPIELTRPPPSMPPDRPPPNGLTYPNGRGGHSLEADFRRRGVGCRIEYSGSFRAGTVLYVEGPLRIAFRHRRGRDCRFYIGIPSAAEWEAATNTALARRDDIVDFIAETVRREEAGSWRAQIGATRIRYD